ncbi:MAG: AmmeMemoRadiSam system radical SAM enzyme [Fibrobacteria bacterium]|nr:AmmeMemoRadiSam system radical SAM enzyme [Fibrobacteria bacterium]
MNESKEHPITRRQICKSCLASAAALSFGMRTRAHAGFLDKILTGDSEKKVIQNDAPEKLWEWSKEAYHYLKLGKNIQCQLCPNKCKMEPESRSKCRVRVHKGGKLYSLVYGNPSAVHVDPIEKKPLYHFYPRSNAFSLGFAGCNLQCLNCQNWELSQKKPKDLMHYSMLPAQAIENAAKANCSSIAYTYNEPTVTYEFMMDTAKLARKKGIKNVWVSNGYINTDPLIDYCNYLDGANIDLKSFSDSLYKKLNYGRLQPVLDTLKLLKAKNIWFEITTLIVPTYSDDMDMIQEMCKWIVNNLGPEVPLHFSRFTPRYKLKHLPPTPPSKLIQARNIAMKEGLRYVYIGNYRTPDGSGAHTFCHHCKHTVIERIGFMVTKYNVKENSCGHCRTPLPGRWEAS